MKQPLTRELVLSLLDYEPETGLFRWKINTRRSRKIGDVAGRIKPSREGQDYICIGIKEHEIYAHRLAWFVMTGRWPNGEMDHKDTDKLNNKWDNLREAKTYNQRNKKRQKNNTSGYKGVSKRSDCNRWQASICVNGKRMSLGSFLTAETAAAAYKDAAKRLHGEFARWE